MSANNKMVWLDRTEIVAGLIFNDCIDKNIVNPDDFYGEYSKIIGDYRKGATIEDIVTKHGYSYVQAAQMAANTIMADGETKNKPIDWLNLLEQAASYYKYGQELASMADKLMMGQPVDPGKLLQFVSELNLGHRALTPLDQVEPERGQWIKTGYYPIDEYVGGIPKAGLIALAGGTGIGKTTFALRLAVEMIRLYDGRKNTKNKGAKYADEMYKDVPVEKGKVAIFSLEMLLSQIVARFLDLDQTITKEERSRILASESAYTVGEIYAVAARTAANENLKAIIIDFADMLVEGEQSEAVMGVIYRSLAVLAKTTGVPVILICQLNRTQYTSGIPRINHIRYSGMAEMMSALILLLYNPSATVADAQANQILPFYPDKGYVIVGKSRFGFKQGKPGAIQIDFTGETGWGDIGYRYFDVHV
jgi:hypothetical protein